MKLGKIRQKASSANAEPLSAWNCRILPIVTWGPPAYIDQLQRTCFHSYTASLLNVSVAMDFQQELRLDLPEFTHPLTYAEVCLDLWRNITC